jgi:hypothetical protein
MLNVVCISVDLQAVAVDPDGQAIPCNTAKSPSLHHGRALLTNR